MTIAASYLSPRARRGQPSLIEGRGLFAIAPFAQGDVVAVKGGHFVDSATLRSLPAHLQETEIRIADDLHLAAVSDDEFDDVMLFLNHSCEPNVGLFGNIVFVAMREIAAGEELATDYAFFDDNDLRMDCRCGRPACRGVVSGQDWRRADLQRRHAGYFSTYLQREIGRL
jgi:SET domain-containing protein